MPPYKGDDEQERKMPANWLSGLVIAYAALGLFLFCLVMGTFFIVGPGEVGVTFNSANGATRSFTSGFHLKKPFLESITKFDVKTQKLLFEAESASKDLQKVKVHVAINYHLVYDKVDQLYIKVGRDFESLVIDPAVMESVKASTAQFPVEEIIVQRERLKTLIESALRDRMVVYNIILESVNLINIDFDPKFNETVENKQIEEQKIKTASYIRQQEEENKKSEILKAEAIAKKQELLKSSASPAVVTLKWIEAWEKGGSKVPQIISGNGAGQMFVLDLKESLKPPRAVAQTE